jgi:hypothetical protein
MKPGAASQFKGGGLGVLRGRWFFPFFLWLVVSLFEDLERVLSLAGYETPWETFGVL